MVDLQFKDTDGDGSSVFGVNQKNFGGDYYWYQPSISMQYKGIYWRDLTNNQIEVVRLAQNSNANEVRVRISILHGSSYQSGWTSIPADGIGKDFNHSLGGNTDDYVVYLQSKGPAASVLGINQHEYGWNYYRTDATSDKWTGVAWSNLEDDFISVIRALDDTAAEEVRIRICRS